MRVFCAVLQRGFYKPIIAGLKRPVLFLGDNFENTGGGYAAGTVACGEMQERRA
jgi:hypothetical protein